MAKMKLSERLGDRFMTLGGKFAVNDTLPFTVARICEDLSYAAFGLVTGTEFSGSGVSRKLARDWKKAVAHEAAALECSTDETLIATMGITPAQHAYSRADAALHERADELIQKGFSRRIAQRLAIQRALRAA